MSSSEALFSFCPQFFPASGTFPTSTLFSSDGQNTGASASASVLLVTIQGWYPLRLTGLISLLSKGLSGFFSSTTVQRHQFFDVLPCYGPALTIVHDLWEHRSLEYMALCQQSNVSAFQHIVYICHCFPAKKRSSSDFMAAVNICSDFGAQEKEICHNFHLFPFCLPWSNGTGCHDLSFFFKFWVLRQLCYSPPSRGSLVSLCFLSLEWYIICISEVVGISPGNLDSGL